VKYIFATPGGGGPIRLTEAFFCCTHTSKFYCDNSNFESLDANIISLCTGNVKTVADNFTKNKKKYMRKNIVIERGARTEEMKTRTKQGTPEKFDQNLMPANKEKKESLRDFEFGAS